MSSMIPNRARSPRFPSHSLGDAIVYAQKIYSGVHRSSIDSLTAYKLLGFAGKSGASATALGSVRQYGLIEGVGDATRISQLGLRVLEPVTPQERSDAIAEAALKPEAFRSILNRFDGIVPTADEPVRAFLIRELGFSKGGAEDCLRSLRATYNTVRETPGASEVQQVPRVKSPQDAASEIAESHTQENSEAELLRIRLTKECFAELRFVGPVTEKALSNLIRHIELTKEVWAEE